MSNSENLRAAVSKYRAFNDERESMLGIDPKKSRVQSAEREVLRLGQALSERKGRRQIERARAQ